MSEVVGSNILVARRVLWWLNVLFGNNTYEQEGVVLRIGDGIAEVFGLEGVKAGELVNFPESNIKGLALNLNEWSVGIVIFEIGRAHV